MPAVGPGGIIVGSVVNIRYIEECAGKRSTRNCRGTVLAVSRIGITLSGCAPCGDGDLSLKWGQVKSINVVRTK